MNANLSDLGVITLDSLAVDPDGRAFKDSVGEETSGLATAGPPPVAGPAIDAGLLAGSACEETSEEEATRRATVQFVARVIYDGRFLETFTIDPERTAKE